MDTKVINDPTFENFIRREAPVVLMEEEELKRPQGLRRLAAAAGKKDEAPIPKNLFDKITPNMEQKAVHVRAKEGENIVTRILKVDEERDHKSDEDDAHTVNPYISDENIVRIGKIKHIMHNQKMFAETILVNAKTGKNERKEVTALMKSRSRAKDKQAARSSTLTK